MVEYKSLIKSLILMRCVLLQVMKKREVTEMDGCKYIEVNDEGLVIERKEGKKSTLEVR